MPPNHPATLHITYTSITVSSCLYSPVTIPANFLCVRNLCPPCGGSENGHKHALCLSDFPARLQISQTMLLSRLFPYRTRFDNTGFDNFLHVSAGLVWTVELNFTVKNARMCLSAEVKESLCVTGLVSTQLCCRLELHIYAPSVHSQRLPLATKTTLNISNAYNFQARSIQASLTNQHPHRTSTNNRTSTTTPHQRHHA